MPKKKKNTAKDDAANLLKRAQKKAEELIATAQNAADSAKKSAKKAKKSAKQSARKSSSNADSKGTAAATSRGSDEQDVPEQLPSNEAAPAAAALPLPTAADPDVPSMEWTVARLRAAAKERGVTGYGSMRKEQLVAALTDAR